MEFEIGQEVVCISVNTNTTLKKDKIYTVKDVTCCGGCGMQSINVGEKDLMGSPAIVIHCTKCRHVSKTVYDTRGGAWHGSFRFVPLSDMVASDEAIAELMESDTILI